VDITITSGKLVYLDRGGFLLESIKDKVAIIGVGCTRFGENFEMTYGDMIVDAVFEAYEDACIDPKQIEAAYLSTAFPELQAAQGRSGMSLSEPLSLSHIPITRIGNYCASGSDAIRNASMAIASGLYDIILVVGVEKLRDLSPRESLVSQAINTGHPLITKGLTAPGIFALFANRYFYKYKVDRTCLAKVAVKNHFNGSLNPKSFLRNKIKEEDVLNAPFVADPLGLMDCTPITDGAAAVILTKRELARNFNKNFVLIKGTSLCVTGGNTLLFQKNNDFTGFQSTIEAARTAYEQAGIRNPKEEIDVAEVHDCFTITEILNYEDLLFCAKGDGWRMVHEGVTGLNGELPINPSGGLKTNGHPVGATGVRQIYEIVKQLQEKAGARQVKNARIGLTHTLGGPGGVAAVTILGIGK